MTIDLEHGAAIARELGIDEHDLKVTPIAGGDIAHAHVLQSFDCWIFLKSIPLGKAGILSAEDDGLRALAKTHTVRVPRVIRRGMQDDLAWMALEYLDLQPRGTTADAVLGKQLAALHRNSSETFGWNRKNYIGLTPQNNPPTQDWTEFFLTHRLAFQFDRLAHAHPDKSWGDLKNAITQRWRQRHGDHCPPPALVHGDLWHGNAASIGRDQPVVFDPAVHYADRETDLAMTYLFGGFSEAFYRSYHEAWPLPDGHETRRLYYKLYHLLNHANMFGGDYLQSADDMCCRILSA